MAHPPGVDQLIEKRRLYDFHFLLFFLIKFTLLLQNYQLYFY